MESGSVNSMLPVFSIDGITTKNVSDNKETVVLEKSIDEEGLEVVECITAATGSYEDSCVSDSDNEEPPKNDDEKSLSTVYKSSDTVFVAFCRR